MMTFKLAPSSKVLLLSSSPGLSLRDGERLDSTRAERYVNYVSYVLTQNFGSTDPKFWVKMYVLYVVRRT